jgi:hypothetical protein
MICLGITQGSWILDFAASRNDLLVPVGKAGIWTKADSVVWFDDYRTLTTDARRRPVCTSCRA